MYFEACESLPGAGVLFLLPFLEQAGLYSYKSHYQELEKGYYFIKCIIVFLAFMYLRRIKNPEQLKHYSPGEFGKVIGLDRIPETRCLRKKLKEICEQKEAGPWNMELANQWALKEKENGLYYIDGHVQVYTGHLAKLGKKHVSRQKLCLPGIQEFWVNNKDGLPYFYVSGQVNEKLLEILEKEIVPALLAQMPSKYTEGELSQDTDLPRFTIVFDREGYSPAFFQKLWEKHRVAVITYRKNVKNNWDEAGFEECNFKADNNEVSMKLQEKSIELNGCPMREIRKLSKDKHQTSVITTNKKLTLPKVAQYMFARWSQENFFKYLRQDYDFDRIMQYTIEQIDEDISVANPEYNKISYTLKKLREKISRKKAKLFEMQEKNIKQELDRTKENIKKQIQIRKDMEDLVRQEREILRLRGDMKSKIKIKDMPENIKYNKLHSESKRFQNIIKMICYRAETSFANLLSPFYKKSINEKRALVKSIIQSNANIVPDYKNNTLTVEIYTLANPRMNEALMKIIQTLNDTQTKYPDTELVLNYKMAT